MRGFSAIEDIIKYIINTRQDVGAHDCDCDCDCASKSILGFHWQASEASEIDELFERLDARLVELDEPKIHRFEYDYESETVYLDIMSESRLHSNVQIGLRDHIKNHILKWRTKANDARIRDLFKSIAEPGTAVIKYERKIHKQPDVSFGQADTLPSLVCEVS